MSWKLVGLDLSMPCFGWHSEFTCDDSSIEQGNCEQKYFITVMLNECGTL